LSVEPPAGIRRRQRSGRRWGLTALLVLGIWQLGPTALNAQSPPVDEEPVLGQPAEIDLAGGSERIQVAAGTRLRRHPDLHSVSVAMVDAPIELLILERREGWVLVRYGAWKGWLLPDSDPSVPLGPSGRPPAPESLAPDPARVAQARTLLEAGSDVATLGPFTLLTDCQDRELLAFLSRVADQVPVTYRRRYGLEPGTTTREVLVLFSRVEDYEAFAEATSAAAGRGSPGLSGQGLAVFAIGDLEPDGVAALLVHELTHLLNRRVMVTLPRPWLEEGMANDLAFCRLAPAGVLDCAELGGSRVEVERARYQAGGWLDRGTQVQLEGPRASMRLIWERLQVESFSLGELLGLGWGRFSDPAGRADHYDISAFFVRYLEEGEEGGLATGFRSFLLSVASGGAAGPPELAEHLGRDWTRIEAGFAAWLEEEISAAPRD